MYGCRIRATSENLELLLRPYEPDEAAAMLPGMQTLSVLRYLNRRVGQTLQSEQDWLTKSASDPASTVWAICLVEAGKEVPIGTTSLHQHPTKSYLKGSGIVIYNREYWGRGVATLAHLARTRYAVEVQDACGIYSSAYQDNHGSRKALERVGYAVTGTRYHHDILDGKVCHADELLFVNPNERSWNFFWGDSQVPEQCTQARERARSALQRAAIQVEFL